MRCNANAKGVEKELSRAIVLVQSLLFSLAHLYSSKYGKRDTWQSE